MDKSVNSCLVKEINSTNFRAIFLSRRIGKKLAEEHPEILGRYKNGDTLPQLAEAYTEDYKISPSVGMNSIYYCLRFFADEGLISLEELKQIGRKHMTSSAPERYKKSLGAMMEEDKKEAVRKSNRSQGYVPYDEFRLELYCGFMNEIEFITYLRERKKLKWKIVTREVNRYFGNGRELVAIRTNYNSHWRRETIQ